jgi:hypothetical protein
MSIPFENPFAANGQKPAETRHALARAIARADMADHHATIFDEARQR